MFNNIMAIVKKKLVTKKKEESCSKDLNEEQIIRTGRTFGVELESIGPGSIRSNIPIGWEYASDSSIRSTSDCPYNAEIKTSILSSQKDEKTFTTFLNKMTGNYGWQTNTSCGTHVHIGIPEANNSTLKVEAKLKTLVMFYTVFEPVIRCLLTADRRGSRYCAPMTKRFVAIDQIEKQLHEKQRNVKKLEQLMYLTEDPERIASQKRNHSYGGRNGINFQSVYYRGTLEIRYHEGSLDPERLLHWIALHSAIIELCMSGGITNEKILNYSSIKEVSSLLTTLLLLTKKYLCKSTIKYTLERFNALKHLNPADGYIGEYHHALTQDVRGVETLKQIKAREEKQKIEYENYNGLWRQ